LEFGLSRFFQVVHKEKIPWESFLFGVLCLGTWIAAGIFFLDAATLWTVGTFQFFFVNLDDFSFQVTPAESRQWNQECVYLQFYDKHDVWHLLSAPALYFTFMYLMYLDDDICDKPQKDIPVF